MGFGGGSGETREREPSPNPLEGEREPPRGTVPEPPLEGPDLMFWIGVIAGALITLGVLGVLTAIGAAKLRRGRDEKGAPWQ